MPSLLGALAALLTVARLGAVPAAPAAPGAVTVTTSRGEHRIPVRFDRAGAPVLPAPLLAAALGGSLETADGWAELVVGELPFRFLLGTPVYAVGDRVLPLAAASSVARDTVFLPFQFVAEVLPRESGDRLRWDPRTARLTDVSDRAVPVTAGWTPRPIAGQPPAATTTTSYGGATGRGVAGPLAPPTGKLRAGHVVAIDPGHGGVDPGTLGEFFQRGLKEKHVTLQIGLLLRDELRRRGIGVRMTRTRDTLIALGDRGRYCTENCDLFVSLHVNALPKRPGYTSARGFETYFLAEAKTEDARRVARMENDAVRFETAREEAVTGGLDFILKDLQLNEHLRESAVMAELVQKHLGTVHDGGDRGVKQAGFAVLTTARRPAVLVELGYGTNPQDAKVLSETASQRKLAEALADAVVAYLMDYDRRVSSGGGS
jgi:N-acetylmuramoyl-L-alanine amidase